MIDFRSDTLTKPTPAMRIAMANAPVGDDVFGEDPTINELENRMAKLFGMEAGIFCPSGTMTNQIAIKIHTQAGQEVICEKNAHVYIYEGGGIAFNSGCQVKPISGNHGRITAAQIADNINPDDIHKAPTSLVCLENTANRGGGSCYEWTDILAIKELCNQHHLKLHLDGARLFNALVAKNETPQQYGATFNTISICLSKGLGCPVGSVLIGSKTDIQHARRIRKVLGGGMRQAGSLAAAGLYALDHHVQRLAEDHHHAQQITTALHQKNFVKNILPVETNIIIFEVNHTTTAPTLAATLKEKGILAIAISNTQLRFVVHLDITPAMVDQTCSAIAAL